MRRQILLLALLVSPAVCADDAKPNRAERAAKKAGDAVAKGAKKAGDAVEKAAKHTGKALDHAADKTEAWIKKQTD